MAAVKRKKEAKGDFNQNVILVGEEGKRSYDIAYIKRWKNRSISGSKLS